jgi:3-hydroxybutyryl-CoA dehydratase
MLKLKELYIGQNLPNSVRQVNQEHINLYAAASKDNNPIHIDQEFAKKTGLGGTVAHGMLILAYVSSYMTDNFGIYWLNSGLINIKFKSPARPGDTLHISGNIIGLENYETYTIIKCDILCQNEQCEPVIVGETKVRINN